MIDDSRTFGKEIKHKRNYYRNENPRTLVHLAESLEALHEVDQIMLSAKTEVELIKAVLPFIRALTQCKQINILSIKHEPDQVLILGILGTSETRIIQDSSRLQELGEWVNILSQTDINIFADLPELDIQTSILKILHIERSDILICVPLIAQENLFGMMLLVYDDLQELTTLQYQIFRRLAGQLASGMHQIRLQQALLNYANQLEERVALRTAELRASEARFRTIFEDSIFGIALLNENGEIIDTNPAFQAISGYSANELNGKTIFKDNLFTRHETKKELFRALLGKEMDYYQLDESYLNKKGQERWWHLTISHVKATRDNREGMIVLMVEDITEKRADQQALILSERLAIAGRLGASLAHEINNPLQSVIGCLGLAEETLEDGERVRRYLEIAMDELERAAGIVNQLRDLSNPASLQEKQWIDLEVLIEKAVVLTRKKCQNRGVLLKWDRGKNLPPVRLMPDRMQQVCLNMILNAVEAMPEGGELRISTKMTDQPPGVILKFSDNGSGIEPDRLDRIFEPFHSTRSEGLGLGLYISRKIVEQHGGKIAVKSRLREGTTFRVWLPFNEIQA